MPSRFTQYGGAVGAEDALREMVAARIAAQMQAQKQMVEERKLGQADRGLDLEGQRNALDRDQFGHTQKVYTEGAPMRAATLEGTKAETGYRLGAPTREADARAHAGMLEELKHQNELGQIESQGNQQARVAGIRSATAGAAEKQWVLRNGSPIYTDQPQPGDVPHRAGLSTGETAQDRQRMGRFAGAQGFIDGMQALRQKINTKMGPAAGATGYIRRGAAAVGMDPDVSLYERLRKAAGRAIAVAILGAQNLSDADAEAYAGMLPDARTDEQTAERLMQQLEGMMQAQKPKPAPGMEAAPAAAPAAGGVEYDFVNGKLVPRGQ